ncbi:right-handed parallel beta-helix repeat-containing protein [Flavihumibacter solisilvae]|nr:right-handed parallel beta-helix repeat-containing protein [Flavihumibacter solisilvae]
MYRFIKLIFLILVPGFSTFAYGADYFVDSKAGNDQNSGRQPAKAWKTLEQISKIQYSPGDRILLKRGSSFTGSLVLKGSGSIEKSIRILSYGDGKRPLINAAGIDFAIQMMNEQYWSIADIETTGGNMAGIFVGCTKDGQSLNGIHITNCYVHDIGDTTQIDWDYSTTTGGIVVVNGRLNEQGKPEYFNSLFNDVVIDNCIVRYNYRWTCLSISSGKLNGKRGNANYIRNCTAEYSAADGIRMNRVQNSFIEYCVMYRNGAWPKYPGRNLGGLGAWFFDAENCTIQYSEASHVQANTTDGGAFDIDYLQTNSTIQYCYGHDCAGYGVSVFGADATSPTVNSVVRYNVLSNNGRDTSFAYEGDFFIFTWGGGKLDGVQVYNNSSFWNPVRDTHAIRIDADFTGTRPNIFSRNVVHSKTSRLLYMKNDTMTCEDNRYVVKEGVVPEWKHRSQAFHSLQGFQQATGHEKSSLYNLGTNGSSGSEEHGFLMSASRLKPAGPAPSLSKIKFNGKLTLLCFADPGNPVSQSQVSFLKSMERQYAAYGLSVYYITTTGTKNYSEDQGIRPAAILSGSKKTIERYGVTAFPTTFLVSVEGQIIRKWENTSLVADLAMAVEEALGNNLPVKHFE